jgi:hypothetical protein
VSVVTLTPAEVVVVTVIGAFRSQRSRDRRFHDRFPDSGYGDDPLGVDIDAAGAELAASKATGLRWNMTCGFNLSEPDLGHGTEVRHTRRDDGGLIVRPKDPSGRVFLLVTGTLPRYRVVGHLAGVDAMRDEFRWEDVWLVPQSRLRPLGELL